MVGPGHFQSCWGAIVTATDTLSRAQHCFQARRDMFLAGNTQLSYHEVDGKQESEMNKTRRMPRFTAEVALSKDTGRYQAAADAPVYHGTVQSAGSVFLPNHPVPCLIRICIPFSKPQRCYLYGGTVNQATGRCEPS